MVDYINAVEQQEDCGKGHACSFCPIQTDCCLDQAHHDQQHIAQRLAGINWIVPVLANKGGVGKSTVAANLAAALANKGYSVGLADADIHGPNAARLFGLQHERIKVSNRGVHTAEHKVEGRGSLKIGSLAFFLETHDTPVVWRDAYKHDYIHHLLGSFDWGLLDFLIVDMPPGTGNELITLSDATQSCNSNAVLVSSADVITLQDTLKAVRYCRDSELPILGLVENYAGVICPHCQQDFELFPRADEFDLFAEQGIDVLTRLPFTPLIGQSAARGLPAAADPESPLYKVFAELADDCSDRLIRQQRRMLS